MIDQQCRMRLWLPLAGEKQTEPLPATTSYGSYARFSMIDYLKNNFRYQDGFLYRTTVRGGEKIGKKAGWLTYCNGKPYWKIAINGKTNYLHHAIFILHHGYKPKYIDHIDGNSTNNRIENLRAATQSQNAANSVLSCKNTSGFKGVTFLKSTGKWKAQLMKNMKHISLGCYATKEEAYEAYKIGSKKYFGDFARPETQQANARAEIRNTQ